MRGHLNISCRSYSSVVGKWTTKALGQRGWRVILLPCMIGISTYNASLQSAPRLRLGSIAVKEARACRWASIWIKRCLFWPLLPRGRVPTAFWVDLGSAFYARTSVIFNSVCIGCQRFPFVLEAVPFHQLVKLGRKWRIYSIGTGSASILRICYVEQTQYRALKLGSRRFPQVLCKHFVQREERARLFALIYCYGTLRFCLLFWRRLGNDAVRWRFDISIMKYAVHAVLCFLVNLCNRAVGGAPLNLEVGENVCNVLVYLLSDIPWEVDDSGFVKIICGCNIYHILFSGSLPVVRDWLGLKTAPTLLSLSVLLEACIQYPWTATLVHKIWYQWRAY